MAKYSATRTLKPFQTNFVTRLWISKSCFSAFKGLCEMMTSAGGRFPTK